MKQIKKILFSTLSSIFIWTSTIQPCFASQTKLSDIEVSVGSYSIASDIEEVEDLTKKSVISIDSRTYSHLGTNKVYYYYTLDDNSTITETMTIKNNNLIGNVAPLTTTISGTTSATKTFNNDIIEVVVSASFKYTGSEVKMTSYNATHNDLTSVRYNWSKFDVTKNNYKTYGSDAAFVKCAFKCTNAKTGYYTYQGSVKLKCTKEGSLS